MPTFTFSTRLAAPPARVYSAWLDGDGPAAMTGAGLILQSGWLSSLRDGVQAPVGLP